MTTINAETLLWSIAAQPGTGGMLGDLYPALDMFTIAATVQTTQTDWRTVWSGNSLYTFSTTPEYMYVSSSSAADVGRIIYVYGLNSQFGEISGYGITNGQAQSVVTSLPGAGLPLSFFRVNYALDITPSTSATSAAAGARYIAASSAVIGGVPDNNKTRAIIPLDATVKNGFIYTVPAGYSLAIPQVSLSQRGDQQIAYRSYARAMSFTTTGTLLYLPVGRQDLSSVSPGVVGIPFNSVPLILPERTDITAEVKGTSPVSGIASIWGGFVKINNLYISKLRGVGVSYPSLT